MRWDVPRPEVVADGRGGQQLRADRRRALVRVPEVATFAVQDGRRVFYDPVAGADPADIQAYLYATVSALLLAQQQRFALHATAVRIGGVDVAIAGARGSGKSTSALALAARGHRLLCDDVLPLEPGARCTRHVPTPRPVRIAARTAQALEIDLREAPEPAPATGKLALVCEGVAAPARLDVIVILRPVSAAAVRLRRLERLASPPAVFEHAYRRELLAPWLHQVFRWAAAVAATVPVVVLERPARGWSVTEVASAIEDVASSPVGVGCATSVA